MWTGGQLTAFYWALVAISFILIVIRFYVNFKGIRKVRPFRDVLVLFAWISFAVTTSTLSIANDLSFNDDARVFLAQPYDDIIKSLKVSWAGGWFYLPSIYFCKMDLIFLYHELAPRAQFPGIFWSLIGAWFCVVAGFLVHVFYLLFDCWPLKLHWDLTEKHCSASLTYFGAVWSTHVFSDLVIYIIPIIIIYRMEKMTVSQKLSAAAMFFIGFVNVFCAVYITGSIIFLRANLHTIATWPFLGSVYFLEPIQILTAILVVCMPQLKSVFGLVQKPQQREKKESGQSPDTSGGRIPGSHEDEPDVPRSAELNKNNNAAVGVTEAQEPFEAASRVERG